MDSANNAESDTAARKTTEHISRENKEADDNDDITLHNTQSRNSSNSGSSVVCRICQLNEDESGKKLELTGCHCKGSIRMCHQGCMQHWIDLRNSSVCELCHTPMRYETTPRNPEAQQLQQERRISIRQMNERNCNDGRRTWFILIFTLILLSVGTSVVTIIFIQSLEESVHSPHDDVTPSILENVNGGSDNSFYVTLSVTLFSVTMGGFFGVIWLIWEIIVYPKEVELAVQIHAWERSFRRAQTGSGARQSIQMVEYGPNLEARSL